MMEQTIANKKYTIQTVKNAMRILRLFTHEQTEYSLSEIASQLNLNISSASRLVKTLEQKHYLYKDSHTKKWRLGYMLINLAGIITTTMEIHREAKPYLEELVETLDEAVHLGVLEGTEIVYLDKVDSAIPLRLNSYIGKRNPSYCTACGKIMLAYQKEATLKKLLKKMEEEGFIKYGPNTVTSADQLLEQLIDIREQGYVVCIDEFRDGISIGAPIYDYTDEVIAAISITGKSHRITAERIPHFVEHIIQTANKISKNLGYVY